VDTERKTLLAFLICARGILFEKGRGVFFGCSASKFSAGRREKKKLLK